MGNTCTLNNQNANNSHNEVMKQWMCTNLREKAHSGERSALGIWAQSYPIWAQSYVCIGDAAFTVKWPPQKSRHSYFLRFTEQCLAGVRSEFVFIQDETPPPRVNQSCQCGAIQSPWHCFQNWGGTWRCGTELDLASACLWKLRNCVTPSIWSLWPHFWIKHKLAFSLGLRNGLVHWDGQK